MGKRKPSLRRAHNLRKGEHYAAIPTKVLKSEAFCTLTAASYRLLMLAAGEYTGTNNGNIALTRNKLKHYGFNSKDTLTRALRQLLDHGLLVLTRQGGFANGGKRPNLYALGWADIPADTRLDIETPADTLNRWATFTKDPSTDVSGQRSPGSCVSSAPIPADVDISSTDQPGRTSPDVPGTLYNLSPEGHHNGGLGAEVADE